MIVPEPGDENAVGGTGGEASAGKESIHTCMADDQISALVILLERRLESPHVDVERVVGAPPVVVRELLELRGVEIGITALDVERAVAPRAEGVEHGLVERGVDEGVEAGGADGEEDMHAGRDVRGEGWCAGSWVEGV